MTMTITIELRIDFDTANKKLKEPVMLMIAKRTARELVTNSMMLADSREPQIMITSGDFFATNTEVSLFDDDKVDTPVRPI